MGKATLGCILVLIAALPWWAPDFYQRHVGRHLERAMPWVISIYRDEVDGRWRFWIGRR